MKCSVCSCQHLAPDSRQVNVYSFNVFPVFFNLNVLVDLFDSLTIAGTIAWHPFFTGFGNSLLISRGGQTSQRPSSQSVCRIVFIKERLPQTKLCSTMTLMRTLVMGSIADICCLLSRVASRFEGTRRHGDNKYRNVIPSSTRVQRLPNTGSDSLNSISRAGQRSRWTLGLICFYFAEL